MVKLYKIKFLKDTELKKIGDIVNCSKKSAEETVNAGYAEYIQEEPKPIKVKKEKKVVEVKPAKPEPNYLEADKELEQLINKSPVEQEQGIIEISKKYNCYQSKLRAFLKNKLDKEKEIIEKRDNNEFFSEKSRCKNCKYFMNGCQTPNAFGGVGSDSPEGHCKDFTEGRNNYTPKKKLNIEDIRNELRLLYKSSPIERATKIEELSTNSEINISTLKEEFEFIKGEINNSRKEASIELMDYLESEYEKIKEKYLLYLSGKEKDWSNASELLARFIKDKMFIYTTKDDTKSEMWIYKDGIYVPQGKTEVKELLRKVLEEHYSTFIANMVISKIETDTSIEADKFFTINHPDQVIVLNGILNVKTLELEPYNPKKIFFNKMPVNYNITKQCPKIEEFLKQVLAKEEDIQIFYELAGFGLLDEYKYEKAFMMHGDGRNGKGKTIELLKRLFGVDSCCSIQLSALKSEDFDVSELFGKRLNLAGDIGNQDLKETNMFKSLTGRDLVSAKRKFLKNIHFQNNAKFVFACNELPMVYDLTKGFWDRWILLDFPYTFVTQEEYDKSEDKSKLKIKDDDIINKISTPEEMSGLLNQAILGLNRLLENKKFSNTKGSEEVKSTWIRKSNSFIAFCWDSIRDEYDGRITKKQLRKKYSEYCKQHKISPKSEFVVKKVLQENYGAIEIRDNERLGDSYIRNDIWEGITWK